MDESFWKAGQTQTQMQSAVTTSTSASTVDATSDLLHELDDLAALDSSGNLPRRLDRGDSDSSTTTNSAQPAPREDVDAISMLAFMDIGQSNRFVFYFPYLFVLIVQFGR